MESIINEKFAIEKENRWYYLGENNRQDHRAEEKIWIEYDKETSISLENHFKDYIIPYQENEENLKSYCLFELKGTAYQINFFYNIQVNKLDQSKERQIGRFEGNPNIDKQLENTLPQLVFKWYYQEDEGNSKTITWIPFRKELNEDINKAYVEYLLYNCPLKYDSVLFEIDFQKFQRIEKLSGKTQIVKREKISFSKEKKREYLDNEMRPKTFKLNVLDEESINSIKSDFMLNFKNIFNLEFDNDKRFYTFYLDTCSESIILFLGSDPTNEESEKLHEKQNYKKLCKIIREGDLMSLEESKLIPAQSFSRIFRTFWYYKIHANNPYLWEQYNQDLNDRIDHEYKNRFLSKGDEDDIKISDNLFLNFTKNVEIDMKSGRERSIIRFNPKNPFPDKIIRLNVPEQIFIAINKYNESNKKKENKTILYANQYGPKNINELIREIKSEIKNEAESLDLKSEYNELLSDQLRRIDNNNFIEIIIKMYTVESFIYKRINMILRQDDTRLFLNLKNYYFSLLFSLKFCNDRVNKNVLYRGMNLQNEELIKCFDCIEKGTMIQFNEFLSTSYSRKIADSFLIRDPIGRNFLFEINLPPNYIINTIRKYSKHKSENEVLLPSGSILLSNSFKLEHDYKLISFNMIGSKTEALSYLLSNYKSEVNLSKMIFRNFIEIQNLFHIINAQKRITTLSLHIYNTNSYVIPYFAEFCAKNNQITHIVFYREGDIRSQRKIIYGTKVNFTIVLINFSKEDADSFLFYFFPHTSHLNFLALTNFENNFKQNKQKNIKRIKMKNLRVRKQLNDENEKEIVSNLDYIIQPLDPIEILKELDISGLTLVGEGFNQLCNLIEKTQSLIKISFSLHNSKQIENISESVGINSSLFSVAISFNNNFRNTMNLEYQEENSKKKKIVFHNNNHSYFQTFLNNFIKFKDKINNLNLSQNRLNYQNFFNTFIYIIKELKYLKNLNLSNNHFYDNLIEQSYEYLKENKILRYVNLEKNMLTHKGIDILKTIDSCKFNVNYNFEKKQELQKDLNISKNFYYCSNSFEGSQKPIYLLLELQNGNIATCSLDNTIRIWNGNDNYNYILSLEGHKNSVYSLIELQNGNIASSGDNTIRIWNGNDNYKLINSLVGHKNSVYSLIELKNGYIASSGDNHIRIWDEKYNCFKILEGHKNYVKSLIELNNGNLASCSFDKTIKIWDCKNNYTNTLTLSGHISYVNSLKELSNGNIASCSLDNTIRIWDGNNNYKFIHSIPGGKDNITFILELQNGNIASSGDKTIRILDVNDNYKCIFTLEGHEDSIRSFLELENGNIASCSEDFTIRIWDSSDKYKCLQIISDHKGFVLSLILLQDGNIASCSNDKTVKIWDIKNDYTFSNPKLSNNSLNTALSLSSSNNLSSSCNDNVTLWDGNSYYKCINLITGHENSVENLIELVNGNIASCSSDKTIKVWDVNNYNCIHTLIGHEGSVRALIELSNGNIVSCSDDKTIRIWNGKDNYKFIFSLIEHKQAVNSLKELSNGNFASCSYDTTIRIWKVSDNYQCIFILKGHEASIESLIELTNGNIASGSRDKTIRIWGANDNFVCIQTIFGHGGFVNSLIELSNGNIASCSDDKTIRIWGVNDNYACVHTIFGHAGSVKILLLLPNGNIASCSDDKSIRVWNGNDNYRCIYIHEGNYDSVRSLIKLSNGDIASCSDDKTIIIWLKSS